ADCSHSEHSWKVLVRKSDVVPTTRTVVGQPLKNSRRRHTGANRYRGRPAPAAPADTLNPMGLTLDPTAFRRWTRACAEALASARAEIDALNVFPVPDSDTGTNSYLTFVSGADAVAALAADAPFAEVV